MMLKQGYASFAQPQTQRKTSRWCLCFALVCTVLGIALLAVGVHGFQNLSAYEAAYGGATTDFSGGKIVPTDSSSWYTSGTASRSAKFFAGAGMISCGDLYAMLWSNATNANTNAEKDPVLDGTYYETEELRSWHMAQCESNKDKGIVIITALACTFGALATFHAIYGTLMEKVRSIVPSAVLAAVTFSLTISIFARFASTVGGAHFGWDCNGMSDSVYSQYHGAACDEVNKDCLPCVPSPTCVAYYVDQAGGTATQKEINLAVGMYDAPSTQCLTDIDGNNEDRLMASYFSKVRTARSGASLLFLAMVAVAWTTSWTHVQVVDVRRPLKAFAHDVGGSSAYGTYVPPANGDQATAASSPAATPAAASAVGGGGADET